MSSTYYLPTDQTRDQLKCQVLRKLTDALVFTQRQLKARWGYSLDNQTLKAALLNLVKGYLSQRTVSLAESTFQSKVIDAQMLVFLMHSTMPASALATNPHVNCVNCVDDTLLILIGPDQDDRREPGNGVHICPCCLQAKMLKLSDWTKAHNVVPSLAWKYVVPYALRDLINTRAPHHAYYTAVLQALGHITTPAAKLPSLFHDTDQPVSQASIIKSITRKDWEFVWQMIFQGEARDTFGSTTMMGAQCKDCEDLHKYKSLIQRVALARTVHLAPEIACQLIGKQFGATPEQCISDMAARKFHDDTVFRVLEGMLLIAHNFSLDPALSSRLSISLLTVIHTDLELLTAANPELSFLASLVLGNLGDFKTLVEKHCLELCTTGITHLEASQEQEKNLISKNANYLNPGSASAVVLDPVLAARKQRKALEKSSPDKLLAQKEREALLAEKKRLQELKKKKLEAKKAKGVGASSSSSPPGPPGPDDDE